MKTTRITLMLTAVAACGMLLSSCGGDTKADAVKALIEDDIIKTAEDVTGPEGKKAMYEACSAGYDDIAMALIAAGVDVNAVYHEGKTQLVQAAHSGNVELVKALAAAGANVNHTSHNGLNIMKHAMFGGDYVEVIRALLDAGAKPNHGDLLYAKQHGRSRCAALLEERGVK